MLTHAPPGSHTCMPTPSSPQESHCGNSIMSGPRLSVRLQFMHGSQASSPGAKIQPYVSPQAWCSAEGLHHSRGGPLSSFSAAASFQGALGVSSWRSWPATHPPSSSAPHAFKEPVHCAGHRHKEGGPTRAPVPSVWPGRQSRPAQP